MRTWNQHPDLTVTPSTYIICDAILRLCFGAFAAPFECYAMALVLRVGLLNALGDEGFLGCFKLGWGQDFCFLFRQAKSPSPCCLAQRHASSLNASVPQTRLP